MKRTITLSQVEDAPPVSLTCSPCRGGGGLTVTIEDAVCTDITIEGWREPIAGALLGLGFHPDTVKGFFAGEASR